MLVVRHTHFNSVFSIDRRRGEGKRPKDLTQRPELLTWWFSSLHSSIPLSPFIAGTVASQQVIVAMPSTPCQRTTRHLSMRSPVISTGSTFSLSRTLWPILGVGGLNCSCICLYFYILTLSISSHYTILINLYNSFMYANASSLCEEYDHASRKTNILLEYGCTKTWVAKATEHVTRIRPWFRELWF